MVIQATNQKAKHPTAAFGFDRREKKNIPIGVLNTFYIHISIKRDRDSFESGNYLELPVVIAAAATDFPPLSRFTVLHFTVRENSGRQVTRHS